MPKPINKYNEDIKIIVKIKIENCIYLDAFIYSAVTDLSKTENYRSFQNLELKPFALIRFTNVDGVPFKYHNKINNVSIPIGPELTRVSPSALTLLLTFEDSTIPNKIKITKITVNVSNALLIIFQNSIILIPSYVLLNPRYILKQ